MTTFVNYEGSKWELTKEQKKFFDEMEKELELPITVVHSKGVRAVRSEEAEGIVFFDYSTNSEVPTPRRVDAIARRDSSTIQLKNHFLLKEDSQREHVFDFNGFPICEMRMYTLWGLTPLENFGTEALMTEFWKDAMKMSCDRKFFERKEEEKTNKIKAAFLEAMTSANQTEVKAQEKAIADNSKNLADIQTNAISIQSEIFRAEQRLEIARKIAEGDISTYEEEIGSLMKHTQISHIDYNSGDGILEIYTHQLYISSPDKKERAPLGSFLIKVNTKNSNSITLHNLTNQRSSKMHPHVEANGAACWGPIGSQIARLAASCRIEGLADLCIRYLETYNVQDGNAQYARYWFTEKDTERQREEFDNQWMNEADYKEAKKAEKKNKTEIKADEQKKEVKEPITDKELEKEKV